MATSQTFLIIEDEPLIAMMLEDFLEALGHRVAGTADTVSDAMSQVDGATFDAAILDVHLRGEACWPVADALADAGRPFLLATGGVVGETPMAHRAAPVLAKPFTIDSVERALNQLRQHQPGEG
ncbi:response regulator [Sphingomonas sanxanigenens]|uniref:Response regulatory domain-containing protein n=1 Tax=Sphingomonas sanxanigenens DSM 19645 = NX02 TaxID=1123269 RepID=W0A9F0_9SPHN|nr:response regulator [Sphingomonas sanxanigenens]AHE53102.1 hypothetical protein NX02_06860 [Sphingomonas sanxanigenens DSM 19645 = NX02]